MKEVHKVAIQKAISFLKVAGAEYCIISPDGKKFGDLKITKKKAKKTRNFIVTPGTFAAIYKDKIENAKVGDTIELALADLPSDSKQMITGLRSSATAYAVVKWGKGTFTSTNQKPGVLQFCRVLEKQ